MSVSTTSLLHFSYKKAAILTFNPFPIGTLEISGITDVYSRDFPELQKSPGIFMF